MGVAFIAKLIPRIPVLIIGKKIVAATAIAEPRTAMTKPLAEASAVISVLNAICALEDENTLITDNNLGKMNSGGATNVSMQSQKPKTTVKVASIVSAS
jgi:hypothetical protein